MKKVLISIAATLIVLLAGCYIYMLSGSYNISQLSHHNRLTLFMIRTTTRHSIEKRVKHIEVPANLDDTSVLITGFQHYNEMCVSCHGAPGIHPDELAEGLYPKPPLIYRHGGKGEEAGIFWIIKNGIKMTSMPAFKPTHDDEKIWAMTAFVTRKLPHMTPSEYQTWVKKYSSGDKED